MDEREVPRRVEHFPLIKIWQIRRVTQLSEANNHIYLIVGT